MPRIVHGNEVLRGCLPLVLRFYTGTWLLSNIMSSQKASAARIAA